MENAYLLLDAGSPVFWSWYPLKRRSERETKRKANLSGPFAQWKYACRSSTTPFEEVPNLTRPHVAPEPQETCAWEHSNCIHAYIHYITLHYIALHCIALHCIALHYIHTYIQTYITLHYITLHYLTLQYTTLHYTTLHYITLHYITLHYITYIHTYIHYMHTLH